jgi:hypothetical protein
VKANEIIFRQNRVVYVLMILLAIAGMAWGFMEHQRHTAIPEAADSKAAPTAALPQRQ